MKPRGESKPDIILPSQEEIGRFRSILIDWYRKHGRIYPWRESQNPFHILIAEMMLQRTKADQVVPVYLNTIKLFPTAKDLVEAKLNNLRRLLKPLGLAWRIPKFKKVAKALIQKFNGAVPETREELSSLPGVGHYIAGAVLSIAYQKPEWIVDSNVVRLFRRYFGIAASSEGRRDAHVIELAKRYSSKRHPRECTLAILDHTALICVPISPRCRICPLRRNCAYFNRK